MSRSAFGLDLHAVEVLSNCGARPELSKVTSIQARLLEIDPSSFQRLVEAYLRQRGYDQINSFGLVLGADKAARGTPDTFITLPNGKHVFAEHTTQQEGVYKKFLADLA